MKSALIIVDMQRGSFSEEKPRFDTDGLVKRINQLATRVRKAGGIIVFVQHDGPTGDVHHPDSEGWKVLPALKMEVGDKRVSKTACDAFLKTDLGDLLKRERIDHIIVTGCATDFCVDTTIRSGLARGYKTTVPRDGHTTSERGYLSATKIIEHHNAVWADFISPAGPAKVVTCAETLL